MSSTFIVHEKDGSGRVIGLYTSEHHGSNGEPEPRKERRLQKNAFHGWRRFLSEVFLPEGYPAAVSEDYLQYQIWNALQAFCSSLASLFASRAVLQGHGVGNASASATDAILLTVLQDVCSRLTTIVAGYYLGTSLYPEAKTYRLLADILNDAAVIFDTLSPHLAFVGLSPTYPFVTYGSNSSLRVVALCLSGAFRALCGAVANGSKAALTVHFATAGKRPGDVGDLNAKDGSKETVLALLGMLCGTVVVHYVHSARMTYIVLFTLIFFHLATNAMAVRVISMRFFNRQRASIAWQTYRSSFDVHGKPLSKATVLPHGSISSSERIFTDSSWIRYGRSLPARCVLGVSFTLLKGPGTACESARPFDILSSGIRLRPEALSDAETVALLDVFSDEKYVLWCASAPGAAFYLLVGFKEGHGPHDHLKAWAHAHEVVRICGGKTPAGFKGQLVAVRDALDNVSRMFPAFVDGAKAAGWKLEEGALVGGSPVTISVESLGLAVDDKKNV